MNTKLTTLQYELMKLLSAVTNRGGSAETLKNAVGAVTPTSVRAAATIITMLPIICIYPFYRNTLLQDLHLVELKNKYFYRMPGRITAGCFCVNVYLKGEFSSNREQNEKNGTLALNSSGLL